MKRRALAILALAAPAAWAQPVPDADLPALVALVAGRDPDAAARARITAAAAAAQRRDAAGQARSRREVAAFLATWRGADAVGRARLRIHARTTLWFDWDNPDGAAARLEAFTLDPVIAAAAPARLVVTEDELSALLAANACAGRIAGVAPPAVDRAALAMELAHGFAGWPAPQQRGFAAASLRLAQLTQRWRAAPEAERDAVRQRLRQAPPSPQAVPVLARALEAAAMRGQPLSRFGTLAIPALPQIGAQLGIAAGMSGALRGFNP